MPDTLTVEVHHHQSIDRVADGLRVAVQWRPEQTASDRELLWNRLAEIAGAVPEDYRRRDSRLHLTISELDGIPLLASNIDHSNLPHERFAIAILTGDADGADADGADAAMRKHLEGSAALLRGLLS